MTTENLSELMYHYDIVVVPDGNGKFTAGVLDYPEYDNFGGGYVPLSDEFEAPTMDEAAWGVINILREREAERKREEAEKKAKLQAMCGMDEATQRVVWDAVDMVLDKYIRTFEVYYDKWGEEYAVVYADSVPLGKYQDGVFTYITNPSWICKLSRPYRNVHEMNTVMYSRGNL